MEDGLVHIRHTAMSARQIGLNPYCSGRWSRTHISKFDLLSVSAVLILIVVEDGLVRVRWVCYA